MMQSAARLPQRSVELTLMRPPQPSAFEAGFAPLAPDETLYFLHIGKTAGTSLKHWLLDHFQHEDTLTYPCPTALAREPRQLVEQKRFVVGHFDTVWWQHYRRPERVITWLREPVDRTLSEYYFSRSPVTLPRPGDPGIALAKQLGLEDCLAHHEYHYQRINRQSRALSIGDHSPEVFCISPSELASRATETLQQVDFFGLVERMQASIDMLSWRYGWRPICFDRRDNVTENRVQSPQISTRARQLLTQMNEADLSLYEEASRAFEARFQAFLHEVVAAAQDVARDILPVEELARLPYEEARQHLEPMLWERYHWATQSLPRKRELTQTFDMPLLGEGWHEREGDKTLVSLLFRWMSRKRACLDLPLQRDRKLKIRFRVTNSFGQQVELFANNLRLDLRQVTSWEKHGIHQHVFEAEVPECSDWEERLTTLSFVVSELCRPCDRIAGSTDDRQLGVAFDWIQVCPG